MPRDLTFDIRYANEPAHDYFGDGKELAKNLREIYHDKGLDIPNDFQSTQTTPPMHFIGVTAPDDVSVDELRQVDVPPGACRDRRSTHRRAHDAPQFSASRTLENIYHDGMVLTQLPQWILVQATTGLAISYTSPDATLLRSAAVIAIIALSTSVQIEALFPGRDIRAAGPIAAMGWVNVLNGIDLLLLSRVSHRAQVQWETGQKRIARPTSQLAWAFWMPYNYRRVRTPWQIRCLPGFKRDEPGYVPTRGRFLMTCVGRVVLCGLLIRLFTVDLRYPGLEGQLDILWGERWDVSFLHRFLVRTSFLAPFAILTRAVIVGVYSVMALSCVGLGVSEPALWPPISGSLFDAWSIRRLWGLTWHQMLRTCLLSNINFVLSSVLRIPRSSAVAYILRLILVFALSGLVHLGMDLGFSVSVENSGALHFFSVQAYGMMVEQLVGYLWFAVFGQKGTGIAGRIIGYLWVAVFLAATAPTWLVPVIKGVYDGGERVPLPLSLGLRTLLA